MGAPRASGSRPVARHKLSNAAAIRVHNLARRRVRTFVGGIRNSVAIQIGRPDSDILEHRPSEVCRNGRGVYHLHISSESTAVDDSLLEIRKLLWRALYTVGRINDCALCVAIQKIGH